MSLWIAFLSEKKIYIASDARVWCEIPGKGIRVYDCIQKIKKLGDKLWMVESGLAGGTSFSYWKLKEKMIKNINSLTSLKPEFFCRIHEQLLHYYEISYSKEQDLYTGIHYLFAGFNSMGLPLLCYVSSKNNFEMKYLNKPYSYIFSNVDYDEIDKLIERSIRKNIIRYLKEQKNVFPDKKVIKALTSLYENASEKNWGIGLLDSFLCASEDRYYFKRFHILEWYIDSVRLKIDMLFYKFQYQ